MGGYCVLPGEVVASEVISPLQDDTDVSWLCLVGGYWVLPGEVGASEAISSLQDPSDVGWCMGVRSGGRILGIA